MISCIVLVKNEEKNIIDCLESVKWCDEVIVIDDYSNDRTVELAKGAGAVIFGRYSENDFSAQRNFGLSKAKGDWILFIDADERVSDQLKDEILEQIKTTNIKGYFLQRSDVIWGKMLKHGETAGIRLIRLAKKNCGEWRGKVHEEWKIDGKVAALVNPLLHFPHQTIAEFIREINIYTSIRAEELEKRNTKVTFFGIIAYPTGKFILNYFIKLGFLDGIQGFIFAITMSFHSFLVRSKLWLLLNEK